MKAMAAALAVFVVVGCGNSPAMHTASDRTQSPCIARAPSPPPQSTQETTGYSTNASAGQTVERNVIVPPDQYLFAVQASWADGDDARLELNAPSSRVYGRGTTDPAVHHTYSAVGETLAIERPEAGAWKIGLFVVRIVTASPIQLGITLMPLSDFAPDALIEASPDRGVAPATIELTADVTPRLSGVSITSLRWDFGDCSPAGNGGTVTHVFKIGGKFTVVLTASDSNGQSSTATQVIVVTATDQPPTPTFAWRSLDGRE